MHRIRFALTLMLSLGLTLGTTPSLYAYQNIDDALERKYLDAYTLVRQAFEDKNTGKYRLAVQKFKTASQYLWEIQTTDPRWQTETVDYLRKDCEKQINRIYRVAGYSDTGSENRRVDSLISKVIEVQNTRRRHTALASEEEIRQSRPAQKKKLLPSLANLIKGKSQRRESPRQYAQKTVRAVPSAKPVPDFSQKKLEALESRFIDNKRELDQWKLQYTVLEEKTREEIQTLSSEFAREKTNLEYHLNELRNQLNEYKGQSAKIAELQKQIRMNEATIQELASTKEKLTKVISKSNIRIDELERALEEAQSIQAKAAEEGKIREGQVVLKIKEKHQRELNELKSRFESEKQKIIEEKQEKALAEKERYENLYAERMAVLEKEKEKIKNQLAVELATQKEELAAEFSAKEKKLVTESSRKLAERNQQIREIEQKLISAVREKAQLEQDVLAAKDKSSREVQIVKNKTAREIQEVKEKSAQAIQKLKNQIASLEKVKGLYEKLKIAHKEDEEVKGELVSLQGELSQYKNKYNELQNRFDQTSKELEEARSKTVKLKEENEYFLEQEKKFLAEKEQSAEREKTWKSRYAALENELNDTRTELAQKKAAIRNVMIEAETKSAQVKAENEKTIMNLLESFKREQEKWSNEVAGLNEKIKNNKTPQLVKSLETANEELKRVKLNLENTKAEKQKLEEQLVQLQSSQDIESLTDEKDKAYSMLSDKEQQFERQKEVVKNQNQRILELKKFLENSESEKKSLYEEVNRLTTTVAQLRLDLKRTDDVNVQLRDTVKALKGGMSTTSFANLRTSAPEITQAVDLKTPRSETSLTNEKVESVLKKVKDDFKNRRFEKALSTLQQQLRLYPANDRFLFYQGLTYSRLNQYDKAIASYEAAVKANSKLAKAYNNLGNLFSQQKKYGSAIENLKKATELDPELSEAYNNMGIVYSHLGQFDEAIKAFIRATDLNPGLVAAFYNLGQIYYQDKKWDAATTSFKKVISLNPDHRDAKKYLAQIKAEESTSKSRVVLDETQN